MSYSSDPEEAARQKERMKRKIDKGTILNSHHGLVEILEDTTAHGCPLVKLIEKREYTLSDYSEGDEFYMTLYLHL